VRHLQHPTENGTPHYQTTRDLCNNAAKDNLTGSGRKMFAWRSFALLLAVCCDEVSPFSLKTVLIFSQPDKSMQVPGGDAGHYGQHA
jgi:hypothetical protein